MLAASPVFGQDENAPRLDFLEYLGSWQAEDEEWFVEVELESRNKSDDESHHEQAEHHHDNDE